MGNCILRKSQVSVRQECNRKPLRMTSIPSGIVKRFGREESSRWSQSHQGRLYSYMSPSHTVGRRHVRGQIEKEKCVCEVKWN